MKKLVREGRIGETFWVMKSLSILSITAVFLAGIAVPSAQTEIKSTAYDKIPSVDLSQFTEKQQATIMKRSNAEKCDCGCKMTVAECRNDDQTCGKSVVLVKAIIKDITGKDADAALGRANITVNKNSVPNDPRSPFVTSGFRIGTPASTTRGFGEVEIRQVADWICDVLDQMGDESVVDNVRAQVLELCSRFPVYADK